MNQFNRYKSVIVREHYENANKFIRFYESFGNACILFGITLVLMFFTNTWNEYILAVELLALIGFFFVSKHYEQLMYDTWLSIEEEEFLEANAEKYEDWNRK